MNTIGLNIKSLCPQYESLKEFLQVVLLSCRLLRFVAVMMKRLALKNGTGLQKSGMAHTPTMKLVYITY